MMVFTALFIRIELLKAYVILEKRADLRLERLGHLSTLVNIGMHTKACHGLQSLVMEIVIAPEVALSSRSALHCLSSLLSVGSWDARRPGRLCDHEAMPVVDN